MFGGTLTSSADCGMTSKPTKKKGTTTRTASSPALSVKSGSALLVSPSKSERPTRAKAMTMRKMITELCNRLAALMPRMFRAVRTMLVIVPMSAHTR